MSLLDTVDPDAVRVQRALLDKPASRRFRTAGIVLTAFILAAAAAAIFL